MMIRPDLSLNITYYLLCNLCSDESKTHLVGVSESGSTRQAITKSDLQNHSVILPSSEVLELFESYCQKLFENRKSQEFSIFEELQSLLLAKMTQVEPKTASV